MYQLVPLDRCSVRDSFFVVPASMPNHRAEHVTEIRQPSSLATTDRLARHVDAARDHVIGPRNAPITLVEYGSYARQHCRAPNERITEVRGQIGSGLS